MGTAFHGLHPQARRSGVARLTADMTVLFDRNPAPALAALPAPAFLVISAGDHCGFTAWTAVSCGAARAAAGVTRRYATPFPARSLARDRPLQPLPQRNTGRTRCGGDGRRADVGVASRRRSLPPRSSLSAATASGGNASSYVLRASKPVPRPLLFPATWRAAGSAEPLVEQDAVVVSPSSWNSAAEPGPPSPDHTSTPTSLARLARRAARTPRPLDEAH